MNDLISVIIPIYNTPKKLLKKSLNSVLNQTYKKLEIILIDDGSKKECIKNYTNIVKNDDRVKIIKKENSGVSDTRNIGLEKAQGKYIMFVDSDDYIDIDYISLMYNELKKESVDIIISGATIVNEKFKNLKKMVYNTPKSLINTDEFIDIIINYPYFTCVKMLFNKKMVKEKFNTNLKYGEDLLFTFNLIYKTKIVYTKNCGYYYVQNSESATYSFDYNSVTKYIDDNIYLFNKILEKYPNKINCINNRLFTKLNICLTRYIQNKKTNYHKFFEFANESRNKMNLKNITIRDINYVSKIQKIELILLKYRLYILYYILIKGITIIKKIIR